MGARDRPSRSRNAIVWQDRRTAPQCDALRAAGHEPTDRAQDRARARRLFLRHQDQAGCSINVAGARERAMRGELAFGTVDYVARLEPDRTARCTSPMRRTRAARCSSTSITGDWDDELLALARRPARVLPTVVASSGVCARRDDRRRRACRSRASPATSRRRSSARPAWRRGLAKNTYGTGCFLLLNTGAGAVASSNNLVIDRRVASATARIDYALEGSVFIGGAVVQWLRDGLKIIRTASRDRGAGGERAGQRRRLPGAGVRRARRAALGRLCARRDVRPDARRDLRAYRARGARVDRVSRAPTCCARCRSDAGHHAHRAARRRRRRPRTTC